MEREGIEEQEGKHNPEEEGVKPGVGGDTMAVQLHAEFPDQKKYLVLHLLQNMEIKDVNGNTANIPFSSAGFFGVCPVFVTRKGAEDYVNERGMDLRQIIELIG